MPSFDVSWTITVEADGPRQAAVCAEAILYESPSWHYRPVLEVTGLDGRVHEIDLDQPEHTAPESNADRFPRP